MTIINVFLPIIIAIVYFLLIRLISIGSYLISRTITSFISKKGNIGIIKTNRFIQWSNAFLILVFFICYLAVFNLLSSAWLRPCPTPDYKIKIEVAGSVIVFGFGLAEDENEQPLPGHANIELNKWINNNINKKIIIGQYGNKLAHEASPGSNSFILMHEHQPDNYVNTFDAAKFALNKLDSLYERKQINRNIVVVAHDMQLQRVIWILEKLQDNNKAWQKYHFIVPDIDKISFSFSSTQFHTKMRFIYNCVELFYTRFRDYFS